MLAKLTGLESQNSHFRKGMFCNKMPCKNLMKKKNYNANGSLRSICILLFSLFFLLPERYSKKIFHAYKIGKLGRIRMIYIELVEKQIVKARKNVQVEQAEEKLH